MTESEKMKLGLWYDANYDQELSEEREKAEDLYFTFNHTAPKEKALREDILKNCFQKWVNVLPFSLHFIPTMVITVTLALIALSITMPI